MTRPLPHCAVLLLATFAFAALGADPKNPNAAKDPAIKVKPIEISATAPLPESVSFQERPMIQMHPGLNLTFMAEGEGLIGVKEDAIVITTLTGPDGKDASKKRNGSPTYEMGAFPKASADGKMAFFSLHVDAGPEAVGHADAYTIDGTVTLLTSPESKTEKKEKLKIGDAVDCLGFKIKIKADGDDLSISVDGNLQALSGIKAS